MWAIAKLNTYKNHQENTKNMSTGYPKNVQQILFLNDKIV